MQVPTIKSDLHHPPHPPAPSTAPTCGIHRTHLRHPPHPPAPSTAPTCTIHPTDLRRPHLHAPLTCPHLHPPLVEESPAVHFPRGWVPQTNQRLLRECQTGRHETRTAVQSGRKSAQKSVEKYFFLYDRLKQHEKTCETTLLFNRTLFLPSVVFRFAAAIWPLQACCKPLFRGAQHHITLKLFAYEHLVANHHRRRWKSPVLQ